MLKLALAVAAIALPDSLNPTLIGGAVYLSLGPHAVRRTTAFTVGAFVITLSGGLLLALGLGDLIRSLLPTLGATTKALVVTVLGAVLVAGGATLWWRRDALASHARLGQDTARGGHSALAMGAGIAAVELLTAFPYFAAITMVGGSSVSLAGRAAAIIFYNVIYVLPLVGIITVCAVMGADRERLLAPAAVWLQTHGPALVAPLMAAVGLGLAVYGFTRLT